MSPKGLGQGHLRSDLMKWWLFGKGDGGQATERGEPVQRSAGEGLVADRDPLDKRPEDEALRHGGEDGSGGEGEGP